MTTNSLTPLQRALAADSVRIVDLTQTLSPSFPALQLPPQFGQVWSFKMENQSLLVGLSTIKCSVFARAFPF